MVKTLKLFLIIINLAFSSSVYALTNYNLQPQGWNFADTNPESCTKVINALPIVESANGRMGASKGFYTCTNGKKIQAFCRYAPSTSTVCNDKNFYIFYSTLSNSCGDNATYSSGSCTAKAGYNAVKDSDGNWSFKPIGEECTAPTTYNSSTGFCDEPPKTDSDCTKGIGHTLYNTDYLVPESDFNAGIACIEQCKYYVSDDLSVCLASGQCLTKVKAGIGKSCTNGSSGAPQGCLSGSDCADIDNDGNFEEINPDTNGNGEIDNGENGEGGSNINFTSTCDNETGLLLTSSCTGEASACSTALENAQTACTNTSNGHCDPQTETCNCGDMACESTLNSVKDNTRLIADLLNVEGTNPTGAGDGIHLTLNELENNEKNKNDNAFDSLQILSNFTHQLNQLVPFSPYEKMASLATPSCELDFNLMGKSFRLSYCVAVPYIHPALVFVFSFLLIVSLTNIALERPKG